MDLIIFLYFYNFCKFTILLNLNKITKFINVYDKPDNTRKFHKKNTPLLGGLILLLALTLFFIFDLSFNYFFLNNSLRFI